MNRRVPKVAAATAVVVAALMVFVVPVGLASAAPSPAASSPQSEWAYGAVKNVSVSGVASDGWAYEISARYGYSVILDQFNLSATQFELTVSRSMGVNIAFTYCRPDCANPSLMGEIHFRAIESSHSAANFTTEGYVLEGASSGQVPALALINSSASYGSNLTETYSLVAAGGLVNRSAYLAVAANGTADVSFTTPLGLIPLNLSLPQSWTSASDFSAVGSNALSLYAHVATRAGSESVGPVTVSSTVERSGNVTVAGSFAGHYLDFGGVNYPVVSLAVLGPFSVREGFILIPASGDLFSSASQSWQSNASSAATVQMGSLDVTPHANGHFGIGASSLIYQSSTTNPADNANPTAVLPAVSAAGSGVTQVPATTLQGAPMSVSDAQKVPGCLASGLDCPGAASSPSNLFREVVGIGILVVIVGAVVGAVLVVDRRRVPATVYPNASLYPPGSTSGNSPPPGARAPSSPEVPPPSEDDPLSHLW